jgi:hypothetical protein
MKRYNPKELGPPDFAVAGLQVWIRNREFAEAQDYWDGNWLNVVAHCGSAGADVWASGPVLHLSEVRHWLGELNKLDETLTGKASLCCMEPDLSAEFRLKDGRGELLVFITPDHLAEKHEFRFQVDQSYLRELTSMLERVLERYPIRGKRW